MHTRPALTTRPPRLFLALWPDDALRQRIAEPFSRWVWPAGSVSYAPRDWHVTLHFLGPVPPDQTAGLADALDEPLQPFEWVLDRPQHWPRGLVVLCPSQVPAPLASLHARLGHTLRNLGRPGDPRPFQPHLTLARHAEAALPPADGVSVVWPVSDYALVVSTGHTHPRYEVVRRYARHA